MELIGYRDSDPEFAFRDPEEIMGLYWPRIGYKRAEHVHATYESIMDCRGPWHKRR